MTPIEIIALIGAVIVPIKIIMLLIGQKFWFEKVTEKYWGNSITTTVLSLVVVIVLLIFLLQELTIIQVWAGAVFGMALTSLALAPFSKYMLGVEKKWFTETNVLKTGWVAGLVWVAIVLWVLYSIFT